MCLTFKKSKIIEWIIKRYSPRFPKWCLPFVCLLYDMTFLQIWTILVNLINLIRTKFLNFSGNTQCHKIFSRSTTTFMSSLNCYVLWDTLYFIICYIYIIGVATLNGTTYIYNGLDYKWGHFTSYIWPDNDNLQSQIFRVKN